MPVTESYISLTTVRLHNKFIKNYRKKLLKSFYVVYNNYIEMTDEKGGFAHEDYLFGSHT